MAFEGGDWVYWGIFRKSMERGGARFGVREKRCRI